MKTLYHGQNSHDFLKGPPKSEDLFNLLPGFLFRQPPHASGEIHPLNTPPEWMGAEPLLYPDSIHPEDRTPFLSFIQRLSHQKPSGRFRYRLLRNHAPHGVVLVEDRRTAHFQPDGTALGHEVYLSDISQQMLTSQRLQQASRKETAALITRGLVHDFNNLMTGIISLSGLCVRDEHRSSHSRDLLQMIHESSQQAQELINRLREINRETPPRRDYCDLSLLVKRQADLLQFLLPKGTRIDSVIPAQTVPAVIDSGGLEQVLLNLAVNSADAMNGPGSIRIALEVLEQVPGDLPLGAPTARISFSDNGSGIPPEILPHITEPFFSTKEDERGSGLGLYNASEYLHAHGGELQIESSVGAGTTVHLWIPLIPLDSYESPNQSETPNLPRRRLLAWTESGRHQRIPQMVKQLREWEQEVRTASSWSELTAVLRDAPLPFDSVILPFPSPSDSCWVSPPPRNFPQVILVSAQSAAQSRIPAPWQEKIALILDQDSPLKESLESVKNYLLNL